MITLRSSCSPWAYTHVGPFIQSPVCRHTGRSTFVPVYMVVKGMALSSRADQMLLHGAKSSSDAYLIEGAKLSLEQRTLAILVFLGLHSWMSGRPVWVTRA